MKQPRIFGRGSPILSFFIIGIALLALGGCNLFTLDVPDVPIVSKIFVNGFEWTGSRDIVSRPDYEAKELSIRLELSGGTGDGFAILCKEGTKARATTVDDSFYYGFTENGSITIQSGEESPITYQITIRNSPPTLAVNPPVLRIPSIGDMTKYLWGYFVNGCDGSSGEFLYESGATDPDTVYGDSLEVRMIITGPMEDGTNGQYSLFTAENFFGGERIYTRVNGEWIPIEEIVYCLLGEGDDEPRVHLLSCPVTPTPDPIEDQIIAGYYKIEVWVRDRLGLIDHQVFTRTIYTNVGCS